MTLRIFNTLSRETEIFTPIEANHVRMYVCGMTIYDLCHMGHARMMMAFDVVYRWLVALGYCASAGSLGLAAFQSTKSSGSSLPSPTATRSPARNSSIDLPESVP